MGTGCLFPLFEMVAGANTFDSGDDGRVKANTASIGDCGVEEVAEKFFRI